MIVAASILGALAILLPLFSGTQERVVPGFLLLAAGIACQISFITVLAGLLR